MRIAPKPITPANFRSFGSLAGEGLASSPMNQGRGRRQDLAVFPAAGIRSVVSRSELVPSRLPFHVAVLERHPDTDQLFVPLGSSLALVIATPSLLDGSPDLSGAEAFLADAETPFVYAAGTWHAPLVALDRAGLFLMSMTETGTARDCEFFEVAQSFTVVAHGT